jgi:catechol 2,3-dioxygenase
MVDFQPVRLAHANLFVGDVVRSEAFYRDVCGLCPVAAEPEIKAAFLSNGASHHDLGLMQVSDGPRLGRDGKVQNTMERGRQAGLNHLAFEVGTEAGLVASYRRALDGGVPVEKTLDHGMSHSVYLFDPDRNAIEFFADTVPDWREFYAAHKDQLLTAQWDPLKHPPLEQGLSRNPPTRDRYDSALLHVSEICGATLLVERLDRSVSFYEKVCGLRCLSRGEEGVALLATTGSERPCLALATAGEGEITGVHALWFVLEETPTTPVAGIVLELDEDGKPSRYLACDPDGLAVALYPSRNALPSVPRRSRVLAATKSAGR